MHFSAEHRFPGSPAEVASVLGDPAFYRDLELPDLLLLEVRPEEVEGLLLRYEFTGDLDPMARRLLGGARLTWSQEVQLRGDAGGRLTFAAEANPRMLHGSAEFVLEVDGHGGVDEGRVAGKGTSTVRRLQGDLTVSLPVVGAVAERRIVPGVLNRLDVEADAVRARLATGRGAVGASSARRRRVVGGS